MVPAPHKNTSPYTPDRKFHPEQLKDPPIQSNSMNRNSIRRGRRDPPSSSSYDDDDDTPAPSESRRRATSYTAEYVPSARLTEIARRRDMGELDTVEQRTRRGDPNGGDVRRGEGRRESRREENAKEPSQQRQDGHRWKQEGGMSQQQQQRQQRRVSYQEVKGRDSREEEKRKIMGECVVVPSFIHD